MNSAVTAILEPLQVADAADLQWQAQCDVLVIGWGAAGACAALQARAEGADVLVADIAESRKRGYSLTRGENVPDVWALAATITLGGETLGVTLAGPRHRIEPAVDEAARLLMATCHLLERSMKN